MVNKFVLNQSEFERELAEKMNLITGRIDNRRVIVVTSKYTDKLETSMDLLSIQNNIHQGSDEAIVSFNLMSGINASHLEKVSLSKDVIGFEEIWAKSPEGTFLVILDPDMPEEQLADMKTAGMGEELIEYLSDSSEIIIIQSAFNY